MLRQSRNSALYVSSRTLFTLAQRSAISAVRSTLGRTNNGHTPLAAITVSFLPGTLAFLAVKAKERAFQEVCRPPSIPLCMILILPQPAPSRLHATIHRSPTMYIRHRVSSFPAIFISVNQSLPLQEADVALLTTSQYQIPPKKYKP